MSDFLNEMITNAEKRQQQEVARRRELDEQKKRDEQKTDERYEVFKRRCSEKFNNSQFTVQKHGTFILHLRKLNDAKTRILKTEQYVFASPFYQGRYSILYYNNDVIIARNERTDELFLSNTRHFFDVCCMNCNGRGKIFKQEKRKKVEESTPEQRENWVTAHGGVVKYKCQACLGVGLIRELVPAYPSVQKIDGILSSTETQTRELRKFIQDNEIDYIMYFDFSNKQDWVEYDISHIDLQLQKKSKSNKSKSKTIEQKAS